MVWTMVDVKVIISEVELATGEKLDLEVKVNGRLKTSLARCFTRVVNGKHVPTKLEFGKTILNVTDYEVFRQIVLHELAHAIANRRYQANCNHDSRFKRVCKEIGCYNDTPYADDKFTNALREAAASLNGSKTPTATTVKPIQQTKKWTVVCGNGHEFHFARACQTTKNPHTVQCSCGAKITEVRQNW